MARFFAQMNKTRRVKPYVNRPSAHKKSESLSGESMNKPSVQQEAKKEEQDMLFQTVIENQENTELEEITIPKRKVRVEKKEKGLIERDNKDTIILTEENKMLLKG